MLLRGRVRALEHRRHPVHAGARLIARAAALALVLIVLPLQAFAFDAASVVRQTIPQARVQGEGELRMYGFHIYNATLFVGPTGLSSKELTARPFALDIEYARAFKGSSIAKRGRQEMDGLKVASKTQTAQWQEEMEEIFPDVQPGDHVIGVFVPERGTTFYADDKVIGTIPGDAFARAFFSIWFDPRTSAPGLRNQLLANGAAQ
jgi:Chalcone isomerase-like